MPIPNDNVTPDISDNEKENDNTISHSKHSVSCLHSVSTANNSHALKNSYNNRPTVTASLQTTNNDKRKTLTHYANIHNPIPSTSAFVSPEVIRPHPKAGPRKGSGKGRKKGSTRILTDTPEKLAIEKEWEARKEKKIRKVKAKVVKRNLNPQEQEETTSEDEELLPSPESDLSMLDESDISCSESENEDDTNDISGDWVVVNKVSQKNLVHR